jgi:hypothetical protein
MTGRSPLLSVVVVAYAMDRELPRTMRTLSAPYQRGIDPADYEIVVVDNGSPRPVELSAALGAMPIRGHRIDDASPSPAHAANVGIELARGGLIGLVIDGARMSSPGLLSGALAAARAVPRAVVTAPAWHLGTDVHMRAQSAGYDQAAEDELLRAAGWEADGYELFSIATPAGSSGRGLFGPMGESSSLFLARDLWTELGGLDERFALPGGGLVNHDLYRRACALPGATLVVLLGEGTFHQLHGGAATSGQVSRDQMWDNYETIRGEPHRPPSNNALYVGSVPPQYLPYLRASAEAAAARAVPSQRAAGGDD